MEIAQHTARSQLCNFVHCVFFYLIKKRLCENPLSELRLFVLFGWDRLAIRELVVYDSSAARNSIELTKCVQQMSVQNCKIRSGIFSSYLKFKLNGLAI